MTKITHGALLVVYLIVACCLIGCVSKPVGHHQVADQVDKGQMDETHRMELRNAIAVDYMNPETHLRLARFHYDQGNKVMAFYCSEYARRIFGDKEFDTAFYKVAVVSWKKLEQFEDESQLDLYLKNHPETDTAKFMRIVDRYTLKTEGKDYDLDLQEKFTTELLEKFPDYFHVKAIAAKFYLKAKKDYEKALDLYIDLYFGDPHFYDWEFAEFRIKEMTSSMKDQWWQEKMETHHPFLDLVQDEPNPRILDKAIEYARENWRPDLIPAMLVMMKNDDHYIQTGALHTLMEHHNACDAYRSLGFKGENIIQDVNGIRFVPLELALY